MLYILLLILLIMLIIAGVATLLIIKAVRKDTFRNEIHISGGADVDTGRMSEDNNYLNVVSTELEKTICIGMDYKRNGRVAPRISLRISNLNTSMVKDLFLDDYIILGRISGNKNYEIPNDQAVSKNHARLFLRSGKVYIEDMGSSNHTYVNSRRITAPVMCNSGDLMKLGKTILKIEISCLGG